MNAIKRIIILTSTFIVFVAPSIVKADIGPKPGMKFIFNNNSEYNVTGGKLLECDNSDCSDAKPLQDVGPQGIYCDNDGCDSMAYGYSQYHRLVLTVNGKDLQSNIFEKKGFDSEYTVNFANGSIAVDKEAVSAAINDPESFLQIGKALIVTVAIELILLLAAISILRLPQKLIIALLVANLTSVPVLWLLTAYFAWTTLVTLLIAEVAIVLYETLVYYLFAKKEMKINQLLLLSFILNLASFLATFIIKI